MDRQHDTESNVSDAAAAVLPPEQARDTPTFHTPVEGRLWYDSRLARLLLKLVPAVAFLSFWEFGARSLDSLLIPTAVDTLTAVVTSLSDERIFAGFYYSNYTLVIGFVISVIVGVPLGLLMGRVRFAERILDVWLDIVMVVPMAAIIPLVIMTLGLELPARAFIVVVFAMPYITVNCRAGIREIRTDYIDMGRCFGASELQIWRRILLPAASPAVWAGLRIGMGRAILGMVISELLMSAVGIGRLLQFFRSRFMSAELYAVVVLLVTQSILLIMGMRWIERKLVPWTESGR